MRFLPSSHWRISSTGGKHAPPETRDAMGFAPRRFPSTRETARIATLLPLLSRRYNHSKSRLAHIKQKGPFMKNIPLSTNKALFVERLKQLTAVLFHFLDWFTPTHPFIADKRARTFLVSFTILFFELFCIRWIPSYVRYLSYFNNFILMASFLGIGLGMLSARRERFWFPPFPLLVALLVLIISRTKFQLVITSTQVLYF